MINLGYDLMGLDKIVYVSQTDPVIAQACDNVCTKGCTTGCPSCAPGCSAGNSTGSSSASSITILS